MCGAVNKQKREETKPVVICDCSVNMLGVELKDQMLQHTCQNERKVPSGIWNYSRASSVIAIHNATVMYWSLPNRKRAGSPKVRLSLAQGLMEKHSSGVPRPAHGRPSIELPPKRLTEWHILEHIPATRRKANVWWAHNMGKGENLCIGAVTVKQGCV
jgi:hypothetical protein